MSTLLIASLILSPLPVKGPVTYLNLTVYPIFREKPEPKRGEYISLDEGLKSGLVVVTETGGGNQTPLIRNRPNAQTNNSPRQQAQTQGSNGTVNTLWLLNKSGKKLMLMSGEIVSGGKQDRIIQRDTLIMPGKEPVDVGVFCVEHGRWQTKTTNFAPAAGGLGGLADPSVRGKAQHERSQSAVWGQVDVSLSKLKTENATKTYQANLEDSKVKSTVDAYVKAINSRFPLGAANGVVVAVNGKLVWMDRFDSNEMFQKYWPKMIRSYALEAMQNHVRTPMPKLPTLDEAMRYADARDGKMTSEAEEGVWKLIKIDSSTNVIYELLDTTSASARLLHASKMAK